MHNIMTRFPVGKDGVLNLEIPTELPDKDLEVLVVYQIIEDKTAQTTSEDLGWSPGFFERVVGGWQGPSLIRDAQGEYEVREELK